VAGLQEMIADPALDRDMRALAQEELHQLERQLPELEQAVKLALLPTDEADARGAILEIRAGTGGEEAALFAGDLYRMYQRYAEVRGLDAVRLVKHEAGGIVGILADVECQAAVLERARVVGMAVDHLRERLDLVRLGPELHDDHISHGKPPSVRMCFDCVLVVHHPARQQWRPARVCASTS
jgi:hypothetical protein